MNRKLISCLLFMTAAGCGDCPNAAVNQVGYQAYQSTLPSRIPRCSPPPPCAYLTAVECRAGAICSNGTCAYQLLSNDAGGQ